MGLEPTNLLTASQALYQLSYAPEASHHDIRAVRAPSRPAGPYDATCGPQPRVGCPGEPGARRYPWAAGGTRRRGRDSGGT